MYGDTSIGEYEGRRLTHLIVIPLPPNHEDCINVGVRNPDECKLFQRIKGRYSDKIDHTSIFMALKYNGAYRTSVGKVDNQGNVYHRYLMNMMKFKPDFERAQWDNELSERMKNCPIPYNLPMSKNQVMFNSIMTHDSARIVEVSRATNNCSNNFRYGTPGSFRIRVS